MNNETNKTPIDYLWNLIPPDIQNMIEKQFNGYEKAKEMEKERMIQFAKQCLDKALDLDVRTAYLQVEKYYNETYGGNK
jgi:hypothetical protein